MGGVWIRSMSVGRSSALPADQAWPSSEETRTCSRLFTGSASIPASPRMLEAVVATRWRRSSASSATSRAGGVKERRADTGVPAVPPGVKTLNSAASRSRWIRAPSSSQARRPLRQVSATVRA